jgi:ribokinase
VTTRLTVVGSVNLDLVARCERLPRPGETVTGAAFDRLPGGKGANQALAARRLGADVRLIGAVGRDSFADDALVELRAAGVELELARRENEPTGVAVILVDEGGENQIVVAPGANSTVSAEQLGALDRAVLTQNELPVEAIQAASARAPAFFCLNAAPGRPVPAEVLARADVVVVNPFELEALGGEPHGLVALTLGAEGAVLLERGSEVARGRPPRVDAVDGTGAGDAFTASLVVALLEGRPREEALGRACAAGAIAASRFGAQPSLPTSADVDAILAGP